MGMTHGLPEVLDMQLQRLLSLIDPRQSLSGSGTGAGGPFLFRHPVPLLFEYGCWKSDIG
jgi:hypothetical protein